MNITIGLYLLCAEGLVCEIARGRVEQEP